MKPFRLTIYRDKKREWRWRLKHANGCIVADSGEGYTRKSDARRAWWRVKTGLRLARVIEIES